MTVVQRNSCRVADASILICGFLST